MRAAVAVAVMTMLVAPAAAAQTVPDLRPPAAFLASSSGEVGAEIQAYCWREPDGSGGTIGVCGDRFDAIDPPQALVVGQGELLTLRFDPPLTPTSVTVSRRETSVSPPLQTFTVPAANPTRFRADFPPGTHIVTVFTTWEQGDAAYVFEVTVRPDPPTTGFLPPAILDAIAELVETARGLAVVDGRIEEGLAALLASTAALIQAFQELVS